MVVFRPVSAGWKRPAAQSVLWLIEALDAMISPWCLTPVDIESPLFSLIRQALVPAGCIVLIAYFAYHPSEQEHGLRAAPVSEAPTRQPSLTPTNLREQRETLEHRVALLSPNHVDPDYADELVRRHLGLVHPDEDIIMLNPNR